MLMNHKESDSEGSGGGLKTQMQNNVHVASILNRQNRKTSISSKTALDIPKEVLNTLTWQDLPEWWKDNEYIISGYWQWVGFFVFGVHGLTQIQTYREQNQWKGCFVSIFACDDLHLYCQLCVLTDILGGLFLYWPFLCLLLVYTLLKIWLPVLPSTTLCDVGLASEIKGRPTKLLGSCRRMLRTLPTDWISCRIDRIEAWHLHLTARPWLKKIEHQTAYSDLSEDKFEADVVQLSFPPCFH